MPTACTIIQEKNGLFQRATIRSGGYVSGVGAYLSLFYRNEEKIAELISLGAVAVIEAEIADCREQAEPAADPDTFRTLQEATTGGQRYVYLWRDNAWHLAEREVDTDAVGNFREITREMILAEDPDVEDLLDGVQRPITFKEAIRSMYGPRH